MRFFDKLLGREPKNVAEQESQRPPKDTSPPLVDEFGHIPCAFCEGVGANKKYGGSHYHKGCLNKARKLAKKMLKKGRING